MFTLSPYPPNYNTINVAHPPKSSLPEHYKDTGQSVYVFIKIFLAFSKCMNVFNLSEEAVNRCKALISASHDPPSLIFLHLLLIPKGQGGKKTERFGCFEGGPHPSRKGKQALAIEHKV